MIYDTLEEVRDAIAKLNYEYAPQPLTNKSFLRCAILRDGKKYSTYIYHENI